MSRSKKGLGRGLDALLGAMSSQPAQGPTADGGAHVVALPVDQLVPGRYQPRSRMDPGSLEELAASIRVQGVMQPVVVRPNGVGRYEIIAGERRWRAAQMAGLLHVPCLIRDVPDDAALALALIENIQRENLNPIEEAQGLQRLIEEFGMTHQQVADAIGRSRSAVTNLLRLLQLAEPVRELVLAGDLEMGHARALLPLAAGDQVALAHQAVAKGWSVRQVERAVQQRLAPPEAKRVPERKTPDWLRLEERLAERIGAPVTIERKGKGPGRLTIRFTDWDELDAVLARLGLAEAVMHDV
ncbi:ParB/RepB/Spo0J family partition protein [Hydrogenophilus thiooxidans]|uniref:ParB/RepB/Spo0J family partition protein n=1 Tax=Hydrogenophilus thiooxidans TaxID=2820326 RepID=UPI001C233B9B|nr:ParB/RepB/Spo0J family partition protein [Hydrogenophilus thiooxidans]